MSVKNILDHSFELTSAFEISITLANRIQPTSVLFQFRSYGRFVDVTIQPFVGHKYDIVGNFLISGKIPGGYLPMKIRNTYVSGLRIKDNNVIKEGAVQFQTSGNLYIGLSSKEDNPTGLDKEGDFELLQPITFTYKTA